MNVNKLVLSLAGASGEALREALQSTSPGDVVDIELTAALDEVAGDQAVFSVRSADVLSDDGEDADAEGDDEADYGSSDESGESPSTADALGSMIAATKGMK